MKTYRDGVEDAVDLLKNCKDNSTEWLIDRLRDYQLAYDQEQARLAAKPKRDLMKGLWKA